jgi:large subunit ribosomal protein L23
MKASFDQIQTVILTEKATLLSEKNNQYEELFKKTVVDVNTANFAGKKKRERTASFGRRANWKKAVVTLKEGDKIELV